MCVHVCLCVLTLRSVDAFTAACTEVNRVLSGQTNNQDQTICLSREQLDSMAVLGR